MKKTVLLALLLVGLALPAWSRPNRCNQQRHQGNNHHRQRVHHNRVNYQRYGGNHQTNRCRTNYRAGYNYRNFGNYRPVYFPSVYRPANYGYSRNRSCGARRR
ncbi:MAG: hypothetical protein KC910_03690 [Candidatus Eremiobacteraeota bacterium]|nr:hypothetical protein [Candidatus Eremiobacteraeota bacterium]